MNKIVTAVLICVAVLISIPNLYAQTYDYPSYPQLDLTYEYLEGDLEINAQGEIRGDVSFDVLFNSELSDSVILHAARMQVEDVLLDERTMDFEIHDDTLIVYLDETFASSQAANLRIIYTTTPVFGILRTYRGTSFTSQLPRTTRHWLPIIDYPSTQLTYDLTVRHPASKSLVMGGALVSNEVISVDTEETRYRADAKIPVSAMFFALSDFESESRMVGSKNIHLHVEQPNETELDSDNLIDLASETLQRLEELTGSDYSYSDLHIIAVHDLMWEHRTFAAGTVLVNVNEDIENQIIYGVAGQWAGVQLREMQWSDSDAMQLLQGYFGNQLELKSLEQDTLLAWDSLYKKISADNIDRYRYYLNNNDYIRQYVSSSKESLFEEAQYPITWGDFTRIIYRETGRMPAEKPEFSEPSVEEETSYIYGVSLELNESDNEANLQFTAIDDAVEELVSVNVKQFSINDSTERELTFTGARDEVVLNIPSGIENIELSVLNRSDITLEVQKPFMYWIYQLQNSESERKRVEAAIGLRQYDDNPDLQLAIVDLMRDETSADVLAEILETLRMVTNGASGTAEIFLDNVGEDQPFEVRLKAIRALGVYEGNDRVLNTLQSIIQSAEHEELKIAAIHSLSEVANEEEFGSIVESMVTQESVLYQVPVLLQALADKGDEENAVQLAETFLSAEFPYSVRVGTLNMILVADQSQQGWENRLEELLTDRDPRIRYRAVAGLQYLNDQERNRLVDTLLIEEYDERVATALRRF